MTTTATAGQVFRGVAGLAGRRVVRHLTQASETAFALGRKWPLTTLAADWLEAPPSGLIGGGAGTDYTSAHGAASGARLRAVCGGGHRFRRILRW